jgi:hypothetical protein
MSPYVIEVYSERCEVHTYQPSKTVWVANGMSRGKSLTQTGRTGKAALHRWKNIAEFRYRTG